MKAAQQCMKPKWLDKKIPRSSFVLGPIECGWSAEVCWQNWLTWINSIVQHFYICHILLDLWLKLCQSNKSFHGGWDASSTMLAKGKKSFWPLCITWWCNYRVRPLHKLASKPGACPVYITHIAPLGYPCNRTHRHRNLQTVFSSQSDDHFSSFHVKSLHIAPLI